MGIAEAVCLDRVGEQNGRDREEVNGARGGGQSVVKRGRESMVSWSVRRCERVSITSSFLAQVRHAAHHLDDKELHPAHECDVAFVALGVIPGQWGQPWGLGAVASGGGLVGEMVADFVIMGSDTTGHMRGLGVAFAPGYPQGVGSPG